VWHELSVHCRICLLEEVCHKEFPELLSMLWKKEANGLLTNLSTTEYQVSKWECVLWVHWTCFSRTKYKSPEKSLCGLYEGGFVFKSTHRLHSWTNDRNGQFFWIFWNVFVSSVSLNKTQRQVRTSNWSFIALIKRIHCHFDGLSFLQILLHFSQLKQELRDARGIELHLGMTVTLYLRKIYQLFQISQYCQWMMTCSNYHLCLKFAHVGNIVFQFRNVSHNHIGEYLSNTSTQFFQSGLSTLDLSYNNISGDISTFMSGILDCVVDIL
jgi:hypothetical protein